ncbi:MAG: nuclear transport factor 2 family protein [Cyclobacteriaceae bacterium]
MIKLVQFTILFFVLTHFSCNQQANTAQKEEEETTTALPPVSAVEVEKTVDDLYGVMVEPNSKLENYCADELTYGHSSGNIQNKAEFIAEVLYGPFDYLSIDTPEQTISLSGEVATVRHIMAIKGANQGDTVDVRIGNMLVFRRIEGELKLIARQAYKLPVES